MTNSRAKGKHGELELKDFLRERGHTGARRGRQFHGGVDSPDVVCDSLPDIHIECKRVEAGNLYNWLDQAIKDAGKNNKKIPIVAHRRSRKPWVGILLLDDLIRIIDSQPRKIERVMPKEKR